MQRTGHLTREVFERYNIVSPGNLFDAAKRLDLFTVTVSVTDCTFLVQSKELGVCK